MLAIGSVLIACGMLGLVHALVPRLVAFGIESVVQRPLVLDLTVPPEALLSVSGTVYLSGIVLVAAGLLRRTALRTLLQLAAERADLESLHCAAFKAFESVEGKLINFESRRREAQKDIRRLAAELDVPTAANERR